MTVEIERKKVSSLNGLPRKSILLAQVNCSKIEHEKERYLFGYNGSFDTKVISQQVMEALLLGLNPEGYTIYVNGFHHDLIISTWLLKNHQMARKGSVIRIVDDFAKYFSCGDAYPLSNGLIFDSFMHHFLRVITKSKSFDEAMNILDDLMLEKIKLINRRGSNLLEVFHILEGCIVAKVNYLERKPLNNILASLLEDVIVGYNCLRNEKYGYMIVKKSNFVDFPLGPAYRRGTLLHALRKREGGWDGANVSGMNLSSGISPSEICNIIDAVIDNYNESKENEQIYFEEDSAHMGRS